VKDDGLRHSQNILISCFAVFYFYVYIPHTHTHKSHDDSFALVPIEALNSNPQKKMNFIDFDSSLSYSIRFNGVVD
jgi:hypothetical protein